MLKFAALPAYPAVGWSASTPTFTPCHCVTQHHHHNIVIMFLLPFAAILYLSSRSAYLSKPQYQCQLRMQILFRVGWHAMYSQQLLAWCSVQTQHCQTHAHERACCAAACCMSGLQLHSISLALSVGETLGRIWFCNGPDLRLQIDSC
jgi:hypothetical protein